MKKITSFEVDHTTLCEGMYISRVDGDVTTFDLRTRRPNAGDYMDNVTMHTFEHLFATYIRNSEIGENVLYFGPMGCQTGFYLLTRELAPAAVYRAVLNVLGKIIAHEGEVFGASAVECGNYRSLELAAAKREAARYLPILQKCDGSDFTYGGKSE
ncbi:MAG: S-ribosylhomocysteine lyase [Clostridia bacterium]|nr:S-ribosylhomocysteine lyase [Clostridia bacterium]